VTRARAFWTVAPGRGEIREEELPSPGPDDVLVETTVSGISRGTEALVFRGGVPAELHAAMRAPFQAGDFPFPVKYGYAAVGRVAAGPARLAGRRVFVLHPHQDRFVVPASAAVPVPDDVPDARATLAANMETAVNVLWDAALPLGARVAVVGAGVVGALAAYLAARVPGTRVELVDVDPAKAATARALGVGFAAPGAAAGGCDVVVHASATGAGLAAALGLAGDEATVVEASWFGDRAPEVPLGGPFHPRRLTLRSSQVGRVSPAVRARWTHRDRMELALRLLADPALDALLTGSGRFEDLPDDMARLAGAPAGTLCRTVAYGPPVDGG